MCLASTLVSAPTVSAADKTAHALYDELNALRIDPAAIYSIKPSQRIELHRGDLVLSFDQGKLAFFLPIDGRITGLVFSGRGHVLAVPRDPAEKQQMSRFLGSPVLDQNFVTSYVRFTDDTATELLAQFQHANLPSQTDVFASSQWEPFLVELNSVHSLRILSDLLSTSPKPYFYAGIEGIATGAFDFLLDPQRDEPFFLGQPRKVAGHYFYDVWASYNPPDTHPVPASFRALHYSIDTSILPNNSLEATASIRLRAESASDRFIIFQLSRELVVDSVAFQDSQPLTFFQNEALAPQERAAHGNDTLYVVLPDALTAGQEFTLRFHYRGNVIQDAGNGVMFVGARNTWYPHFGDTADFATYDLIMRWPRKLSLVATGTRTDDREDGDFRVGHWQTEKPVSVVGFNLGNYDSATVSSANHTIELYANRQLEQALSSRLSDSGSLDVIAGGVPGAVTAQRLGLAPPRPRPADALKQLGKEIDSSIHLYETFSGPFPFRTLNVSQIPGSFAQGWPGLLYLSTFSYLPSAAQERAGLSVSTQEHFSELVPYHEVAHQWWGNVVGWSSYRDQWIDESIASYLATLFADTQKNPDRTMRVWLDRFRQNLLVKDPGADLPASEIGALTMGTRLDSSRSPGAYEEIIYNKGPWIFHMLRQMLRQPNAKNPDTRFTSLLQNLAKKYAYRALSTADLQREVELVMTPSMDLEGGRSMDWFFDQWVRGTGIPHFRVEFTAQQTEKGVLVHGKLFQSGVPNSFITPVPIFSHGAGGQSIFLGTVLTNGPETSFHFLTSTAPHKLLIDPQMTILCTTD